MEFIASAGPLTGGTIVGAIALAICLVIGLSCLGAAKVASTYDAPLWFVGGLFTIVLSVGIWFWAMWPFAYDYHHWIETSGTVEAVGKRIVSDGDGNISEKYVIRFSDGRVRALNDTVGGQLRKGDTAVMRCKRAYDYGVPRSAHGWDCKWSGKRV